MTAPGDALVDIVDEADRVLRVTTRREMRAGRLRHRAVYILVVSSSGELLVHRRAPTKDVWPGRWDLAAGGVVESGETYDEAAVRELGEELGVTAPLRALGAGAYDDEACSVIGRVYVTCHDGPFAFADGEVVEAGWVAPADLSSRLASSAWCPDSIAVALPLLPGGT